MDFGFIKRQLWDADFPAPEADLAGKTVIVTGSNVGLGFETVAHFMRMRASTIIMAVRTVAKGEEAKLQLLKRFPNFEGSILVWELDMASFASTKAFAARVDKELDTLDIAVLNAGVASNMWKVTKDGWEETYVKRAQIPRANLIHLCISFGRLQVNCLSTGLLSILLLPIFSRTFASSGHVNKPHLVVVSSEVHFWAKFAVQDQPNILEALNDQTQHVPADRYQISKREHRDVIRVSLDLVLSLMSQSLMSSSLESLRPCLARAMSTSQHQIRVYALASC